MTFQEPQPQLSPWLVTIKRSQNPPICLSIIHSSIHLSTIHASIHPFIHLAIHPSVYPSIHPSFYPSIHLPIRLFIIHPSIYPPVHLSVHSSLYPSIYHQSIHPKVSKTLFSPQYYLFHIIVHLFAGLLFLEMFLAVKTQTDQPLSDMFTGC